MKTPWLVQRCRLNKESLLYEYMGSAEFEFGSCSESLIRIFEAGVCLGELNVGIDDKETIVYMIGPKNFFFKDYWEYLQLMTDDEIYLKELTYFHYKVKQEMGIEEAPSWISDVNVWFDIQNDVLWTLKKENQENLLKVFEDIKAKWKAAPA